MLQHAPIFVNILQWAYPNAKICFLLGKYESIRIKNCTEVSFKTMLEECKISSSLPELLLHLHYVKRFGNFFVVTFVKVIETHFKMVTLVHFEKFQQDLWLHQKTITEMFMKNTNPFLSPVGFIYLFDKVKCFETIRFG